MAEFGTGKWLAEAGEELKTTPCYGCGEVGVMTLGWTFRPDMHRRHSLAGAGIKVIGGRIMIITHCGVDACGLNGQVDETVVA